MREQLLPHGRSSSSSPNAAIFCSSFLSIFFSFFLAFRKLKKVNDGPDSSQKEKKRATHLNPEKH
jgi:hypothetical protein